MDRKLERERRKRGRKTKRGGERVRIVERKM